MLVTVVEAAAGVGPVRVPAVMDAPARELGGAADGDVADVV